MSDEKVTSLTDAVLQTQIGALRQAAAKSTDPCLTAKFIALSDVRVQETLRAKLIEQGHVLRGIECLNRIGIPENKSVYFNIDCKPGTFCLIKPAFLVVVNVVDGYVVAIVDPYVFTPMAMQGPGGQSSCGCKQTTSLREDCISVTIEDEEACLEIGDLGEVCVPCPGVPDLTAAEACIKFCNGGLRARVRIKVLGNVVGCARFGTGPGCSC